MSNYTTPGTYIEETNRERPISGVATSVPGIAGVTKKGPFGDTLILNWGEFDSIFGGYYEQSYLGYAVRGWFDNGGKAIHVSRVVHYANGAPTSAAASGNIMSGTDVAVVVDALTHGTHGNTLSVEVLNWDAVNKTFDLSIKENGVQVANGLLQKQTLANLETNNASAAYVTFTVMDEDANLANGSVTLTGGNDGLTGLTSSDYIGDDSVRNGIYAFSNSPITLLAVPGITDNAVHAGIETFVSNKRTTAVLDLPVGKNPKTAAAFRTASPIAHDRADFFWPWIYVSDPLGFGPEPMKLIPPSGHILGMIARTDANRGVFKSPAGETDGKLVGALGVEYRMDDTEQGLLNPIGVNAIRVFPGAGIVNYGARTSKQDLYINERRSLDYIEDSILTGTRWTVFENNDDILWGKITSTCESFLRGFWKQGGLKGVSESEAFFVKCDDETNTKDTIALGQVFADIGVATKKPAEFVVFRVQIL